MKQELTEEMKADLAAYRTQRQKTLFVKRWIC